MIPLTNQEKELYENQKNLVLIKKTLKSEIIVIIQGNIEELHIVFAIYAIKYQKRFL